MPRPKTGVTPIRHIRIEDDLWSKVKDAAAEDGTSYTEIVKQALDEHFAKRLRRNKKRS